MRRFEETLATLPEMHGYYEKMYVLSSYYLIFQGKEKFTFRRPLKLPHTYSK